jgi:guanylate kinase
MKKPIVCVITGPAGAGKSTISKLLAQRFEKSAVIENDYVRRMVVGGYLRPWPWSEEVKTQEFLAVKNVIAMTENYLNEGFSVFIDIVAGRSLLEMIRKALPQQNVHIFLLLPDEEALLKRFDNRGTGGDELKERTKELRQRFVELPAKIQLTVMNSTNQTAEETAEEVFLQL